MSELENKTVAELRLQASKLGVPRYSRMRKDDLIRTILEFSGGSKQKSASKGNTDSGDPNHVTAASFEMNSIITKPSARKGDRATTTIRVSCGASYGDFPVVGKTVGGVMNLLLEVLNISKVSNPHVNGQEVESDYILKEGDNLEFLKPSGSKG